MPPTSTSLPGLIWLLSTLTFPAAFSYGGFKAGPADLSQDMWEYVNPVAVAPLRSKRHALSEPRDAGDSTSELGCLSDERRGYRFTAFGQHFHLQLRCHDNFIAHGLMVQELSANFSRWVPVHLPRDQQDCFYTGHVRGDPDSTVALSLCQGLMGHIRTSRGRFFIEPTTATANSSGVHVIYRHRNKINHCGVKDSATAAKNSTARFSGQVSPSLGHQRDHHSHIRKKRSESLDLHVEVMVVADSKMHRYHGHNLHHYVLTLMSIVALLYKDASIGNSLSIAVVKLVIIDEEVDRELISSSATKTLKTFCKWQAMQNDLDEKSPNHHDTAILLTREDLCRSPKKCETLGLAELGTMCDPNRSCSIVEDNGLSAAFTIAHELGHVMNMPHDDEVLKCRRFNHGKAFHVMARMLDYNTYPWTWSTCSNHYLTEFLDAGLAYCLLNLPVVNKLRGRYAEDQQAGELFDKDKQCELVYGYGSRICPYMPVCKLLWCTSSEQIGCRTHHMPWADGTYCGDGKWCQKGECKKIERSDLKAVDGRWGKWGKYGSCSRTCGGGIQKQTRDCVRPKPRNGGKYCVGRRSRYRSCNTTPCPPGSKDFREEQCAEFNGKHYNIYGLPPNVTWVPVLSGINPKERCKLYCRVSNGNAYYILKEKVIDGTPCGPDTYDICVNGLCKPAGCDHVLASNKKLDMCGMCGGNNSTCKTFSGHLNRRLSYGYTDIVRIPKGSTNIDIRQKGYNNSEKDDNYIALKSPENEYILNGNFSVVLFKKLIQYGGSILEYTGAGSAEERINSTKPLQKDLIVQILSVKDLLPPDIEFEYVVSIPPHKWETPEEWSSCSSICQGERHREAACIRTSDNQLADEKECSRLQTKPSRQNETCNLHCRLRWEVTHKSECSAHCGMGTRMLTVKCIQRIFPGKKDMIVDSHNCDHLPSKPPSKETCEEPCTRSYWEYGTWSTCSQTCGHGRQIRSATCVVDNTVVNEIECSHIKKVTERSCGDSECPQWKVGDWIYCSVTCGTGEEQRPYWCEVLGMKVSGYMCDPKTIPEHKRICKMPECPEWDFGQWGQCSSSCGRGISIRVVRCRSTSGKLLDDDECDSRSRPDDVIECPLSPCPDENDTIVKDDENEIYPTPRSLPRLPSVKSWRTGPWGECSITCGDGLRKRKVICYDENENSELEEKECSHLPRPQAIEICRYKRCGRWRVGEWSECSVTCGSGVSTRNVTCVRDSVDPTTVDECDESDRPDSEELCQIDECPTPEPIVSNDVEEVFAWHMSSWGWCSRTCGGGYQRRQVVCQDESGIIADRCEQRKKPVEVMNCNTHDCPTWKAGYWGDCTRTCGTGLQRRRVVCLDHEGKEVLNSECDEELKPADEQSCNRYGCDVLSRSRNNQWQPSPWTPCSSTCGGGFQERQVECVDEANRVVSPSHCPDPPPPTTQNCSQMECPQWRMTTSWAKCSVTCGTGTQMRRPLCVHRNVTVPSALCAGIPPSIDTRICSLPLCPVQWRNTEWSQCTKSCGKGTQHRSVFCVDSSQQRVDDSQCNESQKPRTRRGCNKYPCPFMWTSGEWSECSASCGPGMQMRSVDCHQVNAFRWVNPEPVVAGCNETEKPSVIQGCNYGECDKFAHWRPGAWSECSSSCEPGIQRRRVYCMDRSGQQLHRRNCQKEYRPPRRQTCHVGSCGNSSCLSIQRKYNIRSDGEHMIRLRGKNIRIYCADMNTPYPQEYLTLPSGHLENYSEMYSKRLLYPFTCPYNGARSETCECVDDGKEEGGFSVFSKIRVNITNLRVVTTDFSFSEQIYGKPIPYAEAADCYSMRNCPQGRFSINLVGSGFIISEFTDWIGQGTSASVKILRNKDGMRIQGHCGGYCGKCTVDPVIGLQLDVAPP